MAVSRGLVVCCFLTLVVSAFFIRVSNAEIHAAGHESCGGIHPDDHQRCIDRGGDDDDNDFDDTYKIINQMKIQAPLYGKSSLIHSAVSQEFDLLMGDILNV
ncbi:protein RALF-like 17 [Carica papaya]|uniref:protein RALF-like 17 n=1 Tax=Carica papaya TaxID=3649 RepID=UPI000B8CBBF9|nr:protein RALF-like 17 [Carica papaya]